MLHPDVLAPIRPHLAAIKVGLTIALVAALGLLLWSWDSRGDQIKQLESWQSGVINTVTLATVEPGKDGKRKPLKPEDINRAIEALKTNLEHARRTIEAINGAAQAAKESSDARDIALRASLAAAEQRYATAAARIKGLESRRPAATPGEAATLVEEDSKAAWQGWSQK